MHVLIIDDHELFSAGFRLLLDSISENLEITCVKSCQLALEQKERTYNLILMDYYLPDVYGNHGIEQIKIAYPEAILVIVSSEESSQVIQTAISCGAAGFIPKSSPTEIMVSALKIVLHGGIYLPPQALDSLTTDINHLNLTKRQREVVALATKGMPNKRIAKKLNIAEGTVKAHLFAAYQALGISNRTEAVMVAAKYGI